MIFVLIAFFQALNLTLITGPFNELLTKVFQYLPQLLGAMVLLVIAWLIATGLKLLITRGLTAVKLDEKLADKAGLESTEKIPLSKSLSEVAYWLVFLLFLPAILTALSLQGILEPVQGMINKLLDFLPNILTAAVILLIGWFVATIVKRIVTSLLVAVGVDRLSERVGLHSVLGMLKLSGLIGLIVYVFILIPIIIAALNALALDAITIPASNMLNQILETLPAIFAAVLILMISYILAKILSGFVTNLLKNLGFDNIFIKAGVVKDTVEEPWTPSNLAGYLILVVILLFATMEAFNTLGFENISMLLTEFTIFGGHVLLGLVIILLGLILANFAASAVKASKVSQAGLFANIVKIAVLILAGAMGLRQMGIANEIINIAFGLLLGAIAVAAAISFGIGGRDLAAKKLEEWNNSISDKS